MFGKKGVSEADVCRTILDREEVLQMQVFNFMVENLRETVANEKLMSLQAPLSQLFSQHTNGLVDAVSKKFSV